MRNPILATALAAVALTGVPATAQTPGQTTREYHRDVRDARRDYRDDLRDADSRHDVRDARQDYRQDIHDARTDAWRSYRNYDYNHLAPGQRYYYPDRYYRSSSYYQPRRLGRADRIYVGSNGRYYCRRSDGTTGLIIGGIAGGALGAALTSGHSQLLGTLVGAGGGALLGRAVDRGQVVCR